MKKCTKCKVDKPLIDFHIHKKTKDGRYNTCKSCHLERTNAWRRANRERTKELQRNRVYNLEENWYETKLVEQEFRCAGCLVHQKDLEYALCVDHCHTTEKPRGLLCRPCNLALGNCNDNEDTLRRLAKYAEETRKTAESEDRGPEEGQQGSQRAA